MTLPIHDEWGGRGLRATRLRADAAGPAPELAVGSLYYRSSLCTSADGRPFCQAFERRHQLEPLLRRELPARPSLAYLPYDRAIVDVGLFRVVGRVSEAATAP